MNPLMPSKQNPSDPSLGLRKLAPPFLLLCLTILFFREIIFKDQVWFDAAALNFYYPWKAFFGSSTFPDILAEDSVRQYLPHQFYPVESLFKHWRFPLWNPLEFTGVPFFATGVKGVIKLSNLLYAFLSFPTALNLQTVLSCFLAGFLMYLFLASRLFPACALIGSVVYMFSGYFLYYSIFYPHLEDFILFPLSLWALEKAVKRSGCTYYALCGVVWALMFFGGREYASPIFILIAGLYGIHRILRLHDEKSDRVRHLLYLSAAGIFFVGLAAVKLLPFLQWLGLSDRVQSSDVTRQYFGETSVSVGAVGRQILHSLLSLGLPADPAGRFTLRPYLAMHVSALSLLLAIFGFKNRRGDRSLRFFSLLALCGLMAVVFGEAALILMKSLVGEHWSLGVLKSLLIRTRADSLLVPALAIAAAFSAQRLSEDIQRGSTLADWKWTLWAGVIGFFTLFIASFLFSLEKMFLYYQLRFAAVLFGLIGIVHLAVHRRWLSTHRIPIILLVFIIFELLYTQGLLYRPGPRASFYPLTPALKFLADAREKAPHRAVALNAARGGLTYLSIEPEPNLLLPFGVEEIGGYEALAPARQMHLYNTVQNQPEEETPLMAGRSILSSLIARSKIMDMLNVKYLITSVDRFVYGYLEYLDGDRFRPVYSNELVIFENRSVFPRAFVVSRAETIRNAPDLLKRLLSTDFDPRKEVLLEKEVRRKPPIPEHSTPAQVRFLLYEPERSILEVAGPGGFLVVSDAFHPGWKARVDGKEAPLYRANYVMRAVELPPGKHRVEFEFRPAAFRVGIWISAISLLVMVAFAVGANRWESGKRQKKR